MKYSGYRQGLVRSAKELKRWRKTTVRHRLHTKLHARQAALSVGCALSYEGLRIAAKMRSRSSLGKGSLCALLEGGEEEGSVGTSSFGRLMVVVVPAAEDNIASVCDKVRSEPSTVQGAYGISYRRD